LGENSSSTGKVGSQFCLWKWMSRLLLNAMCWSYYSSNCVTVIFNQADFWSSYGNYILWQNSIVWYWWIFANGLLKLLPSFNQLYLLPLSVFLFHLPSISSILNAQILCTNVLSYVFQSQNVTRKSCAKHFCTKNLHV